MMKLLRTTPLGLLLLLYGLAAQDNSRNNFQADRMQLIDQGREIILEGNARIRLPDLLIHSDQIAITGTTQRQIRAEGSVLIERNNQEQILRSQQLRYEESTQELHAWGNVQFKDSVNQLQIESSTLSFDPIRNNWRFEVDVRLESGETQAQSMIAIFHESTQILELHGEARLYYEGQLFEAQRIIFNQQTNQLFMEQVHGGSIRSGVES